MKLIIGGSSYIGRNLFDYFSCKSEPVMATYHNSPRKGMIHFDLENSNLRNLNINLKKVDYAFICSAITGIDECKKNEERAYKINVSATKNILEQFFQLKITPVFFSSDFVFDGKKGNYHEEDRTNPCTVYGNHKKEIEDWLLSTKEKFLIARLSKIFGLALGDKTILTSWLEDLQKGQVIRCANDQIFCSTYIVDLANALDVSLQRGLRGLYNIASPESFSRFELANMLKSQLEISSEEIVSCSIKDFNFLDERSLNTSMNTEKFARETGFKFTKMKDCIAILEELVG